MSCYLIAGCHRDRGWSDAYILGRIGIVPLAVTTSLTINFLRKPTAKSRIIAECKLLKIGRSLIVGEISLYSDGSDELVAHVVGTYSVPPAKNKSENL